ncbi:hypothetical protein ATO6_10345 [Oceanicola sp. 22II-s10i]|uniref:hypothetical protein n=1 Tax=Oceanicola sp. 22II-s10i TaxID=1317116 RepID=UPI000B52592F|nr:hypothetical protein [Oceanicola sp. 22II-s10i]OWU84727.1 hypothetical protein ATO6_10345 [Oceanicola sp. 22II-s10i]
MRFYPTITAALTAAFIISPAAQVQAQDGPSLWDIIKPERLIERAVQTGIMALRTQMDVVYGDMTVSPMTGELRLSDVTLYPPVPWQTKEFCTVTLDRLTLRSAALDEVDRMRFVGLASGVSVSPDCLDLPVRAMAGGIGLVGTIRVPTVTVDLDYDVPSGGAFVHMRAMIDGFAAADLTADFDYLWFEDDEPRDPIPVAYLKSAALGLENLGGWDSVKGFLPPPLLDPQTAGQAAVQFLQSAMIGLTVDAPEWADTQTAVLNSVSTTWAAFLADPRAIYLDTGFDPAEPVYLDLETYDDEGPGRALIDLQPRLGLRPMQSAPALLPAALVGQAMNDASTLSEADRRKLGLAFLTGTGVPRHVAFGTSLLTPLADKGDGEAALALARSTAGTDDEQAYKLAMIAGATRTKGAVAVLDDIEARLGFEDILRIQFDMVGKVDHPVEPLQTVAGIREQAVARATGEGVLRSYSIAALWSGLGAALGDAESALMLELMDERARLAGPEAQALWRKTSDEAAVLGLRAWSQMDLPGRYTPQ